MYLSHHNDFRIPAILFESPKESKDNQDMCALHMYYTAGL